MSVLESTITSKRKHNERLPLAQVVVVPEENYRWGSREAMERDLQHREEADPGEEAVNTYEQLKESIRTSGIREPVGVIKRGDVYHVVYGFTRVVAAKELGLSHIPAYAYDSGLTDIQLHLLQLQENSTNLRRSVNWIASIEAYYKLVDSLSAKFANDPDAIAAEAGEGKTPLMAAKIVAAQILGTTAAAMSTRRGILNRLHPEVVSRTRLHSWSYSVSVEFCSGDKDAPFSGDFIMAVVKNLEAKGLDRVTPKMVRYAKSYIKSNTKCEVFAAGTAPVSLRNNLATSADSRLTTGAARDASVAMVDRLLAKNPDEKALFASLPKTTTWHRIIGMGMACGECTLPACASNALNDAEGSDDNACDKQSDTTSARWATSCAVHAGMLRKVKGLTGVEGREWIRATTETPDRKIQNRVTFLQSLHAAISWWNEQAVQPPIYDAYQKAINELKSRIALKGKLP